jgi:uncharacterized membrane protein
VNGWIEEVFGWLCGRYPGHVWAPGGIELPFCQRCTGLYAGAAIALALQLSLRPCLDRNFLAFHGLLLLLMAPFGLHWLPQGPVLRTLSGVWFAFAVVAFLTVVPSVAEEARRRVCWRRSIGYLLGLGVTLLMVPLLARKGGVPGAILLVGLGGIGALGLALLLVANLVAIARRLAARRKPASAS